MSKLSYIVISSEEDDFDGYLDMDILIEWMEENKMTNLKMVFRNWMRNEEFVSIPFKDIKENKSLGIEFDFTLMIRELDEDTYSTNLTHHDDSLGKEFIFYKEGKNWDYEKTTKG